MLFMMSKIQNLNGTHNLFLQLFHKLIVVYDVKDTKFEWNSQRFVHKIAYFISCLWCQRYKIWMELTTDFAINCTYQSLFMMSKIQNLNGTHNFFSIPLNSGIVVYDVKDTKFEWNSQLAVEIVKLLLCCLWCQRYKIWMELTTLASRPRQKARCLWCQRYKIWMELTT